MIEALSVKGDPQAKAYMVRVTRFANQRGLDPDQLKGTSIVAVREVGGA